MPVQATTARQSPRFILVGQLRRDFIVLPTGEARLNVPGGNLIYAAVGLAVWDPVPPPGLLARVGEDYPEEWLAEFARRGFDVRGVHILPQPLDLRAFFAYPDQTMRANEDPIAYFARLGLPFPKELLSYQNRVPTSDSRARLSPTSLHQGDLLSEYLDAAAAHICPLDYLSHSLLPAVLRQAGFTLVTLDPSPGYMTPSFRDELPALLTGLTAFLPSEEEVRALFQSRSEDLWEMAEVLSSYGCEMVVIKRGERGQLLYDAAARARWEIPAYSSPVVDPTGIGDAFCGGFLAGFRHTYDPLQAVLHGNISASIVIEGHGPFYALEALPGLAQARLEALRQSVRKL